MAGPQIAGGGDGRIWFAGSSQIFSLDPAHLVRNPRPPEVVVRWLHAGNRTFRDPSDLRLPAGTRAIDISYAGLSLSVPERVQFRYRLDGVDEQWVDPGSRRTASYANLTAGRYRFTVIAANSDGVWNRKGATLAFEIRPTIFESTPFRWLCIFVAIVLLWLAYSLRIRSVGRRTRARMIERMEERQHIARELHDTLLQSVQALTWRFQLAIDDLPENLPARAQLERSIDRADQLIADGRDKLQSLRPLPSDMSLREIVDHLVEQQDFHSSTTVSISVVGSERPLDPPVVSEAARIMGEALFNIWRHARAQRVDIVIRYNNSLMLRISDDGAGISAEILENGGKADHFGLRGMRERAEKLGASLLIDSKPNQGTTITLEIPGVIAFQKSRRLRFAKILERMSGDVKR